VCLAAIALGVHPTWRLVIAANRDEFHARPSWAAHWWPEPVGVFGGRDRVGAGSWLAVSRRGRFALVTNQPGRPAPPGPASRGRLVSDFVVGPEPPLDYLEAAALRAAQLPGFSLVIGDTAAAGAVHADDEAAARIERLEPGVNAFSNAPPHARWPKAEWLARALERRLAAGLADAPGLLALLNRRDPVPGDAALPAPARSPFVVGSRYGTRASTVVRIAVDGRCEVRECRFGPHGRPAGTSVARFRVPAG